MRSSSEIFEDFLNSLEEIIDLQDDAWSASKDGKWRMRDKIYNQDLPKSKLKFKSLFDEYLDRRFETFLMKKDDKGTP